MNMDEQYVEMRRFRDELERFNNHLSASMRDLETQHEHVDPYWQDEMRRMYDTYWKPLEEHMHHYLRSEGPQYNRFLQNKIVSLGKYLHGS